MDNCVISVAVTKNECKAVMKRCIKSFVAWCTNAELNGIAGHGEEPPMFIKKLLGCGNMCYQQKMTASGGACKVKRFFVCIATAMVIWTCFELYQEPICAGYALKTVT